MVNNIIIWNFLNNSMFHCHLHERSSVLLSNNFPEIWNINYFVHYKCMIKFLDGLPTPISRYTDLKSRVLTYTIHIASRYRNDFFVKPRKLHSQTFWKFTTLLAISRGFFFFFKSRLHLMVFGKVEFKVGNIAAFSENTSQEKGKAVSHGPITWADGNPVKKPNSVYTHKSNALISVGEWEELKSTSSEERFPLEWVITCVPRVQSSF